jgi:hypothetical protein
MLVFQFLSSNTGCMSEVLTALRHPGYFKQTPSRDALVYPVAQQQQQKQQFICIQKKGR